MRRVLMMLAAVAVLIVPAMPASAGGYCGDPGSFQDAATDQVVMKADCFGPTVARVDVGDEVTFRNLDSHAHTVGGVANTFGDAHKEIPAGGTIGWRFEEEGVFPFFCVLHPGMAGAIVVGDGSTSSAAGAAAVPVEPAAASAEKSDAARSGGFPFAMAAVIAAIVLGLGVAGTVLLRRRRALGAAA